MIRMIFSPQLGLNAEKIGILSGKLTAQRFDVKTTLKKPDGSYQIILDTMQDAGIVMRTLRSKDCILCPGCNSLHYKAEQQINDPFVCPCGKVLNKPQK